LFFLSFFYNYTRGQESDLKFRNLTIDQGLSNNYVTAIHKDAKGFVWVGTYNGLNRYDGYDFKTIVSNGEAELKLSGNIINCIFEDSKGILWVGTMGNGLNCFDTEKNEITVYKHDSLSANSICSDHIFDMEEDAEGNIWIATGGGLSMYDPSTQTFLNYTFVNSNLKTNNLVCLAVDGDELWIGTYGKGIYILDINTKQMRHFDHVETNHALDIYKASNGLIWIATDDQGLITFNPKTNVNEQFLFKKGEYNFINNRFPNKIKEDSNHTIWITTDRGGLYTFNPKDSIFHHYTNNPALNESLVSDALTHILIDNNNMLWIGTYDKGVCLSNLNQRSLIHKSHEFNNPHSISDIDVNCIFEDSDGQIWIGTENGLNRCDTNFVVTNKYFANAGLPDNVCLAITESSNGEIWIGSYTGGLSIYNKKMDSFRYFRKPPDGQNGISSDFIRSVYEDSFGLMWIGTIRGGVDVYNPSNDTFINYPNTFTQKKYLNSSNVLSIREDSESNMWLVTYGGGVNVFDRKSGTFRYLSNISGQDNSLSSDHATCQLFDSNGDYWVGTNNGLNKLNPDKKTFTRFFIADGLACNSITGIVEDDRKNLWISTQNGLSVYHIPTDVFTNYYKEDGLQENVFHYNAITKLKNGSIVCGGSNGLNIISASVELQKRQPQKVVITGLSLFNNKVNFGVDSDGRVLHDGPIEKTQEINLAYKDKLFAISYSTLEYNNPKQTKYKYKIDELHDEWIHLGSKNTISFHNLRPDYYTFRIKSITVGGAFESDETILYLNIRPPFYRQSWFYVFCTTLIAILVFLLLYARHKTIQKQQRVLAKLVNAKTKELSLANKKLEQHRSNLEQLVEERTMDLKYAKDKAEKADALKTAFLANMSHEIRTPMNAILGFVDLLSEPEIGEEDSRYFKELVQSNGLSLMRLIDDIMDLARIESGDIYIRKERFELTKMINEVCAIYGGEQNKLCDGVQFTTKKPDGECQIYTDPDRLKQIIINLINNASKFTEQGEIRFDYQMIDDDQIQFVVRDTGIGIPPAEVKNIFNRFNKLEGRGQKVYRGTGLGLAITKELVKLLGGSVWVESQPGKGSAFYFTIDIN